MNRYQPGLSLKVVSHNLPLLREHLILNCNNSYRKFNARGWLNACSECNLPSKDISTSITIKLIVLSK